MSYQVIKLSNGEDIVCQVHNSTNSSETQKVKISSPLRMETITRDTSRGTVESLALSRWVQPYSDEKTFNVERNSIVIMTPASAGLSRYYEYVLNGMNKVIVDKPTKQELDNIEREIEQEEELENISSIFDDLLKKTTYH
tara:strand:+ start:330 stop:749 length:420 start_codon:yes stop_codon:yes gene_type:complete